MQRSDFRFEIKSVGESDGTFTGLASTYGNVDLVGHAVMPGAFTKTLRDAKGPFPVLNSHDQQIGYAELKDTASGLFVNGNLVLHSDIARQAYALMKAKALRGLSIGYELVRSTMNGSVSPITRFRPSSTAKILRLRLLFVYPIVILEAEQMPFSFQPMPLARKTALQSSRMVV